MPEPGPLRVVIDTSSLVSYVLTGGDIMRQVIEAWRRGDFLLLSSAQTRAELAQVLARPEIRKHSERDLAPFAEGIAKFSVPVPDKLEVKGICRDPKDDKFIACAVEGEAQYLVTSDHDLLAVRNFRQVSIVNPGQFLVALQLANISAEEIGSRYSPQTIRTILEEMQLDESTRQKLVAAVENG